MTRIGRGVQCRAENEQPEVSWAILRLWPGFGYCNLPLPIGRLVLINRRQQPARSAQAGRMPGDLRFIRLRPIGSCHFSSRSGLTIIARLMAMPFSIVGLGEALFDIFQDRQVLGGAPLNMAVHSHQLASPIGGQAFVVSRVGQDELGRELTEQLKQRGMDGSYVQTDPDRATGKVYVSTDIDGSPEYEIVTNVAWDWIQFDPDDEVLAGKCDGVCFGSLAQRVSEARSSILRFVDAAKGAVRMFDVNLRQDYYDQRLLRRSIELANVVKLNLDELKIIAPLLGLTTRLDVGKTESIDESAAQMLERFELKLLALTRGKQGTVLYTPKTKVESEPVRYEPVEDADAVGAGDACAAGLMIGLVKRWPMDRTLQLANHVGAFVASQPGATPELPAQIIQMVQN